MKGSNKITLYVISDSLGEMGKSVSRALQLQFPGSFGAIKRHPFVVETSEIHDILTDASKSLLYGHLYASVLPETREYISRRGAELGIPMVDILGGAIDLAEKITGKKPINEAGLNRRLDKEYSSKISAVEFAVKYDDGTDPSSLKGLTLSLSEFPAHQRHPSACILPIITTRLQMFR